MQNNPHKKNKKLWKRYYMDSGVFNVDLDWAEVIGIVIYFSNIWGVFH